MSGPGSSSWMISRDFKDEKYSKICCMLLWYMLIFYVRQCRHNRQHPVHTWNVTRRLSSLNESDTIGYGIIVIVGVRYEHDHLSEWKAGCWWHLAPKTKVWCHSPWQGNLYWPQRIMRIMLPCQSSLQLQYFFFSGGCCCCNTNTHECDWLIVMVFGWFW